MATTAKKIVCPVDKRHFLTKEAFAQHNQTVHGKANKAPSHARATGRSAAEKKAAMVAVPTSVRGGGSDLARLRGVDRIIHGDIDPSMYAGKKVFSVLVTPGLFSRLKTVSIAYQRIRYIKLRFRIETLVSTNTSGGYLVGFVRDPADTVDNINALMAQQGSVATKWWQSTAVEAPTSGRLFYTSSGVEVREFSPGRLVLMVDGPPTQKGSYTVYAEWEAELSSAGFEIPSQVRKDVVATSNWYTRGGHQGIWDGINDSASSRAYDLLGPDGVTGKYWKLPHAVVVTQSNGAVRNCNWVHVKDANTVLPCYRSPTDEDSGEMKIEDLFLAKGEVLEDATPSFQGEEQAPSSSDLLTMTADSEKPSEASTALLAVLQEICQRLDRSLTVDSLTSPKRKVSLDSTEKSSSMESPQD